MDTNFPLVAANANILVVDDTIENLNLLTRMLKDFGYLVRPVPNGRLALMAAKNNIPDLILMDITMPEMDGYEVCRRLKEDPALRDVPVLFISALSQTSEKVKAFTAGGVDYITKPFQIEEVKARIETHLKLYRLQKDLAGQVQKQVEDISNSQMSMIFALAKLSEMRDDETGQHIERVQALCRILATLMISHPKFTHLIDMAFVDRIFFASPLHDIGKVGIPDSILMKNGKLTTEEFEIMKTHAMVGSQTLAAVQKHYPHNAFINMGISISRSHHEKWNGKGYPDGLSAEAIPLSARMMAVVDVYDALRSKRVYKAALTHEGACAILRAEKGQHFDPDLIDVFFDHEHEFEQVYDTLVDHA